MPDLQHSLRDRDLGHLRILAERWGLEIEARDQQAARVQVIAAMLEGDRLEAVLADLPEEARLALADLRRNGGRLPWPLFSRRHGKVREMGAGRRDRERPDRDPISATEMLWYRGLIDRAFFDATSGPEEFAYIPDELAARIPARWTGEPAPLGAPASPDKFTHLRPASDDILDHACTLLAALRMNRPLDAGSLPGLDTAEIPVPVLLGLLEAGDLLSPDHLPEPEATRQFLEATRAEALQRLAAAWLDSQTFNELRLLRHLHPEGGWENEPRRARSAVLSFLQAVPARAWWSLPAFVQDLKEKHPDYQRPAGDYDSWFLRDRESGVFLRGFESWDRVDGALAHFLITGPLHQLGFLDLGAPGTEAPAAAFRKSAWFDALVAGQPPEGFPAEDATIHVRSDGRLQAPWRVPRAVRYQLARFCEWEDADRDGYRYRLSPAALDRAADQELRASHLIRLLDRYAAAVPPNLVEALKRWESHGTEARLEQAWVLRVERPEIMQALRRSRAARFLGDPLSPTAAIVRAGAQEKILNALAELGVLGDLKDDRP